MARLVYSVLASLDGYIADRDGNFDWAEPDEEVHSAVNDESRELGTLLLGRRMYEVSSVWDEFGQAGDPEVIVDFGEIWRATDKIVVSTTLGSIDAPRTRLVRRFDAEEVRELVASAERDVAIAGPELAGYAFRAGLVDDVSVYTFPVVVGGGTAAFPTDLRVDLELVSERRFASGVVRSLYRLVRNGS